MRRFALLLLLLAASHVQAQITDDFNRGDSAADLGANWTDIVETGYGILTNEAYNGDAATYRGSAYTGTALGDNQFAQVVWASGTEADDSINLFVRQTGADATHDGYLCQFRPASAMWSLIRVDDGVETTLSGPTAWTPSAPDTFRCEAIGTSISIVLNGSTLDTEVDATYASGRPGLGGYRDAPKLDDFAAGNLDAALQLIRRRRQ